MRGETVPQRMNADTLGDAGTPGCPANDPMQLARTRMLPAVAGKQPGLTGRHPALLARDAPPFVQYLEQDGRENDVPILLALALLDPDDHPVTIDIGELERYDLRGSQAGGISQAQDRSVLANFGVSDRRFRFKPAGGFGGNRQAVSVQSGTPLRMGFGPDFGEPPLRDTSYLALAWQSKYSCHYL